MKNALSKDFTYKGCVERGFKIEKIQINENQINQERADIFGICHDDLCNNKTPGPKSYQCNSCFGEIDCQRKDLPKVYCEQNILSTYNILSKHFGGFYKQDPLIKEYECFSIKSTLKGSTTQGTTSVNSTLIFKGCVQKGFDVCNLKSKTFEQGNQHFCEKTEPNLDNKTNSGSVQKNGSLMIFLGFLIYTFL